MSQPQTKLDVLDRLEKAIGRLADGTAPLEELVAAHAEALGLLDEAEAELKSLRERAAELSRSMPACDSSSPRSSRGRSRRSRR